MTTSPSEIESIFSPDIVALNKFAMGLRKEVCKTTYKFLDTEEFEQKLLTSRRDANRIYWQEILYRAHWAASANLLRHIRWYEASTVFCTDTPNYLAFAACLRGMIEGAVDGFYSLREVPLTLALNCQSLLDALNGRSRELSTAKELEEALIHFLYARKEPRSSTIPDAHIPKTMKEYIKVADKCDNGEISQLYADLCQIAHPAAQSVLWMTSTNHDLYALNDNEDLRWIQELSNRHRSAIDSACFYSVNSSVIVLKTLNLTKFKKVYTESLAQVNLGAMPAWLEVMKHFNKLHENKV